MSTAAEGERQAQDTDQWEWEDEGLFVRDLEGRLIRYDAATRSELDKKVELEIDGQKIAVKKALIATDEQGRPRRNAQGHVIPRPTTIYDAVSERYGDIQSDGARLDPPAAGDPSVANAQPGTGRDRKNPIPILCHTLYFDPAAVCRLCVVQLARFKRSTGKVEVDSKLLPACQHRVEEGMIVDTIASPNEPARQRVERAVQTLLELLMADHPAPCAKEQQRPGSCELEALARRFNVTGQRYAPSRSTSRRERCAPRDLRSPLPARFDFAGHRRGSRRLHPLRSLRQGLRRHQGESRHRPHGQGLSRRGLLSTSIDRWETRRAWPAASVPMTARPVRSCIGK